MEADLKPYNHTFSLYPFLDEIQFVFDEVLISVLEISNNRYLGAVELIESHINDFPNKVTVSVGQVKRNDETIGPETELFNLNTMDLIKRLTKRESD